MPKSSATTKATSSGGGLTIGTTAITSGVATRLLFEGAGNVVSESANLTWSSPVLTIGVAGSATGKLQLTGATSGTTGITVSATGILNFLEPADNTKIIALNFSGMTAAKTLTISSNQTTNQILTIPNITGADTIAVVGLDNSFSVAQTIATSLTTPLVIGSTSSGGNITLRSTSHATKGKILFGTSAYDEVNNRLGIIQTTPTSALQVNKDQNSVTQNDANGLLLANATAATSGLQSISPAIVLQGNGWKTTATAASQDVRFRIDLLPVQGSSAPSGSLQFAGSINGASYISAATLSSSGNFAAGGQVSAGTSVFAGTGITASTTLSVGSNCGVATQLIAGTSTTTSLLYRTTNAGSDITPKLTAIAPQTVTAGTLSITMDATNSLGFSHANGTRHILGASIGITNLTNTAGSESSDLSFSTQSGGTAATSKVTITAKGNVLLAVPGALATNATDGFTYIPTCAGTPTGVPTAATGMRAIVWDSTNYKLYVYDNSVWNAMN